MLWLLSFGPRSKIKIQNRKSVEPYQALRSVFESHSEIIPETVPTSWFDIFCIEPISVIDCRFPDNFQIIEQTSLTPARPQSSQSFQLKHNSTSRHFRSGDWLTLRKVLSGIKTLWCSSCLSVGWSGLPSLLSRMKTTNYAQDKVVSTFYCSVGYTERVVPIRKVVCGMAFKHEPFCLSCRQHFLSLISPRYSVSRNTNTHKQFIVLKIIHVVHTKIWFTEGQHYEINQPKFIERNILI